MTASSFRAEAAESLAKSGDEYMALPREQLTASVQRLVHNHDVVILGGVGRHGAERANRHGQQRGIQTVALHHVRVLVAVVRRQLPVQHVREEAPHVMRQVPIPWRCQLASLVAAVDGFDPGQAGGSLRTSTRTALGRARMTHPITSG